MRRTVRHLLLIGTALATANLYAQTSPVASHEVNIAVTYNALHSDSNIGDFWQQGGGIDLFAEFYRGLGITASLSGMRTSNIHGSGVNMTTITEVFGPRYRWRTASQKLSLFGEALLGESHASDSVFPSPSGAVTEFNTFALQIGGGADIRVSKRFAVRPIQVDWLRTQFPNSATNVQNNVRFAAGIVFKITR